MTQPIPTRNEEGNVVISRVSVNPARGRRNRTIATVSALALTSTGLVVASAIPAHAVGCNESLNYIVDYGPITPVPVAVLDLTPSSAGTACSSTVVVTDSVSVIDYVVVAGGGGAGDDTTAGGGGGAGGVIDDSIAVTAGQSLSIVVGDGGAHGVTGGNGTNGTDSSLTVGGTTYTAAGGGGGGGPTQTGAVGGSGGGGGMPSGAAGTGTGTQGYDGDSAGGVGTYGGGGGGAGGAASGQNGGGRAQFSWTDKVAYGGNGAPGNAIYESFPGTGGSQADVAPLDGFDGIVYLRWEVTAPSAPTAVSGNAGDGQVVLTWAAPSTGGAPIDEYVVQYSSDGGATWTDDSTGSAATSYTVTGLTNGTSYVFQVRAINDAHLALPFDVAPGPYSSTSAPVTPVVTPPAPPSPIPPSAPTNVTATAGNAQASIVWGAPASPGSFSVTTYRVIASPGGQTCLTTLTSCTIAGLTNGTTYTFSASALSGAGWGASATSNPVTPSTDPAPTPAPGPQPLPTPLPPGGSSLTVNGVPQQMTVTPNAGSNGLGIVSDDFTMSLEGLGPDGQPLDLGPDGVLVLDQERQAQSSGRGFLAQSDVDFYIDPPVATTGSSARSAGTYVGTLVTHSDGTFSGTVTLPDTIEAGEHVLQAVGLTAQGDPRAVSIGVMVSAWIQLDQGPRKPAGRHDRIATGGSSTGIPVGVKLTPHIRYGTGEWKDGVATITVQSDGSFTWKRLIRKDKKLTAYVSYEDINSNEVIWLKVR